MVSAEFWDYQQIWFSSTYLFAVSEICTLSRGHRAHRRRKLTLTPTHESHGCGARAGASRPLLLPLGSARVRGTPVSGEQGHSEGGAHSPGKGHDHTAEAM